MDLTPGLTNPIDIFRDILRASGHVETPVQAMNLDAARAYCEEPVCQWCGTPWARLTERATGAIVYLPRRCCVDFRRWVEHENALAAEARVRSRKRMRRNRRGRNPRV